MRAFYHTSTGQYMSGQLRSTILKYIRQMWLLINKIVMYDRLIQLSAYLGDFYSWTSILFAVREPERFIKGTMLVLFGYDHI